MSSLDDSQTVRKLTDKNYHGWFPEVRELLMSKELWPYVYLEKDEKLEDFEVELDSDKTKNSAKIKIQRNIKRQKAYGYLTRTISTGQKFIYGDERDPSKVMTKIMAHYKSGNGVSKAALYRELSTARFQDYPDVSSYMNKLKELSVQLADAGMKMPEDSVTLLILFGLPSDYYTLVSLIED